MYHIIAGIITLVQYLERINETPEAIASKKCCYCHKACLRKYGFYKRKAHRSKTQNDLSLNPIFIQRFICTACNRTCSQLPECIPRRRWYL